MLRLSILDKRIDERAARMAKREKLIQKLNAPILEQEEDRRAHAADIAQRAAAAAEAEALTVELADAVQTLARLDTMQADYAAAERWIGRMQAMCEGGYFGLATNVNKVLGYGRLAVELQSATRARLADIDKRLKELDQ